MLVVFFDWQVIHTSRTHTGLRLGSNDDPIWVLVKNLFIVLRPIVESRYVNLIGQLVLNCKLPFVEVRSRRASRIFLVKKARQAMCHLRALRALLIGDLVADTPENNARVV